MRFDVQQSLDEETLKEEEEEAVRLYKEQLKRKSEEDFGLGGEDESDKELTLDVSFSIILFVWCYLAIIVFLVTDMKMNASLLSHMNKYF